MKESSNSALELLILIVNLRHKINLQSFQEQLIIYYGARFGNSTTAEEIARFQRLFLNPYTPKGGCCNPPVVFPCNFFPDFFFTKRLYIADPTYL